MALSTPVDREFAILPAGFVRDKVVLANFREGLRALLNPETGLPFTNDEIQRATQPRSRWYVGAQAIDDYGQAEQRKALWLADQIRIERASTKWLEGFHARLWGEEKLVATGGSGTVNVPGVPGTIVAGSTTLGDPSAFTARDAAGNVYQVFSTATVDAGGSAPVVMQGVGVGVGTNPKEGELLTWIFRDPNMGAQATVLEDFSGGTDRETDAEQASRIAGIVRHRPGGGNDSHVRSWARASSNAIEEGFVYPCFLSAGSCLVAITQKRGALVGPTKRQPSPATLAQAISYLTPPLSPVFPPRAFVVVTGFNAQPSDVILRLGLQRGSKNGYLDARPWPSYNSTPPAVTAVTSNTDFNITCPGDSTLPSQVALATLTGAAAPRIMLWDETRSRFALCSVASIQDLGSSVFRVLLTGTPTVDAAPVTVVPGLRISPAMDASRHPIVAKATEEYFDTLGPGDLFDLQNDPRGGRCVRFPSLQEEKPSRAGAVLATRVIEALGGASADAMLAAMSVTQPSYPTNLVLGPNMITCGHVGVYEL